MKKTNDLTPSLEDYLETILELERKNRVARVKDIAQRLSVQMPSVTGALKTLKSRGLVEYEKNSFINLTPEGIKIAAGVLSKHHILVDFLSETLHLSMEQSEREACKIEHSISTETAGRFKKLNDWIQKMQKDGNPSFQDFPL